ncbi:MAG: hypothetical protein JWO87_1042, partial [Phycisphaerales bacterium]|nr:hypothetical protein [Phycisphaerales bacterium]
LVCGGTWGCQSIAAREEKHAARRDASRAKIQAVVIRMLPQEVTAEMEYIRAHPPRITGYYHMAGSYEQIGYCWDLPNGQRLPVNYEGGIDQIDARRVRLTWGLTVPRVGKGEERSAVYDP